MRVTMRILAIAGSRLNVDVHRAQLPILTLRVHTQCDRRASTKRRAQELVRRRTKVLTARLDSFVGREGMMSCDERDFVVWVPISAVACATPVLYGVNAR